jgi:hypothetical protein
MTSRFERRLARVEKLQRPATEAPTDPRMFVIATLVGFHCCDRHEDEHPLQAYSAAAKGPDALRAMQRLLKRRAGAVARCRGGLVAHQCD